jgi:hypothetical protein
VAWTIKLSNAATKGKQAAIVAACACAVIIAYVHFVGIKPLSMSGDVYSAGRQAVSVTEDYKSGRLSSDAAEDELETLWESATDSISSSDVKTEVNDTIIAGDILAIKTSIGFTRVGLSSGLAVSGTLDDNLSKLKNNLWMVI